MPTVTQGRPGESRLLQGNEAIARGALEAGVRVAAAYPGTPSSEIIENLARVAEERDLYVEWSINEKVALEVAAAASFSELRSLCAMKQVGVNVAADFLLHLAQYGTRGGMILVSCEDPGALSSSNEGDSRQYARMMEFPMLEPADFQEAKDITKWAFELSEEIRNVVMVRSVTRMSHASGKVVLGELSESRPEARFNYEGPMTGQMEGPVATMPNTIIYMHGRQQDKLKRTAEIFEDSPFNRYVGSERPELLIVTSSVCHLYCKEAVHMLGIGERVGLLKLATTWPLPPRLLEKHLAANDRVLVVEELLPFLEENIKVLTAELGETVGNIKFYGKKDGSIPSVHELNPDIIAKVLADILGVDVPMPPEAYTREVKEAAAVGAPPRMNTFCPGCPHRASFWSIHNALAMDDRKGFVCGDIGCYSMGIFPAGFETLKTLHAMGSGTGLASGFGQLGPFGLNQPVLSVCGDSTFFHAVIPALANAVHHNSDIILVVMDNSGTAMTGFQPHPGLTQGAMGNDAQAIDIGEVCRGMGADVKVCDPFDLDRTRSTLLDMLENGKGVQVLILKQICALSPEKKSKKMFEMSLDPEICLGDTCGCNRLCTRSFRCPGLVWDKIEKKAMIDEVMCAGCGVCASICPSGAITASVTEGG
ncbi:MAG: 4Fe-4S binding protein [Deltaproteobacteria bacterium]|nr:4Fe-4S binding protein [Deltaproteobacteria bacterium]